jgi:hypothetical protein
MKKILMIFLLILIIMGDPKGQGSVYVPGNVITLVNAFPNPANCLDGNLIILTAPQGGFIPGTMHVCLAHAWLSIVPASWINFGTSLPSTCIVGAVFTLTPSGQLYTCPVVNTFVEVGVPSRGIIFINSGICPSGYTEMTQYNGQMFIGTTVANGNIGTTFTTTLGVPGPQVIRRVIGCRK